MLIEIPHKDDYVASTNAEKQLTMLRLQHVKENK
jgi:hypothetical protein